MSDHVCFENCGDDGICRVCGGLACEEWYLKVWGEALLVQARAHQARMDELGIDERDVAETRPPKRPWA